MLLLAVPGNAELASLGFASFGSTEHYQMRPASVWVSDVVLIATVRARPGREEKEKA